MRSKQLLTYSLIVLLVTAMAFGIRPTEKYYNFKMTPEQFFKHYNKLNTVKKILDESTLPHNQVNFAMLTIDSLQIDFVSQLPDSVKRKP